MGRSLGVAVALALGCTTPSVFDTLPTAGGPSPDGVETCNGRDDDGDGFIDEDASALCDDGDACTVGRCEGAAGCFQEMAPDTCIIDGECVAAGTSSPGDVCAICDPVLSTTDWSPGGADISCDDGEACTVNDRCDGQGRCRGDGDTPEKDEQEPSSRGLPFDTELEFNDDATIFDLYSGTFHEPGDVDSYLFSVRDDLQVCIGVSKQPRPTARVTGDAEEVCVQVFCWDGSDVALECLSGYPLGRDTCCGPVEVITKPDCAATDDSVDLFVDVVGDGETCGSYQVTLGNTESGGCL